MDFQSAMETFAEAWVAANAGKINFQALPFPSSIPAQGIGGPGRDDLEEPNQQPQLVRRTKDQIKSLPSSAQAQAQTSPGMDLSTIRRNSNSNVPITGGKAAIPIHCLLKTKDSSSATGPQLQNSHHQNTASEANPPDIDDFLIIPAATPFNDLLPTALSLLGHPKEMVPHAEGWISLRNWKPLRLDQVSDAPQKTVGDILHDLTNHATLTILITRSKCPAPPEDLKEKLLRLLLAQSSSPSLGQVTTKEGTTGAEELRRRFDIWYSAQHTHTLTSLLNSLSEQPLGHGSMTQQSIINDSNIPTTITHIHEQSKGGLDPENHPVYQGISPHQKTRMRTSFDPEMELPRLQDWFAENPHPSRHQIQQYVRELNSLECRKDRKPLDINNVIYWFKNARAAQKRNELRYNGLSPHPPFPLPAQPRQSNNLGDPNNNNSHRLNHNGQSETQDENTSPATTGSSSSVKEINQPIRIKQEEDDSTSVDIEVNECEAEPRNLSLVELQKASQDERERDLSLGDESSCSVSPRSSPPLSPRPNFEFSHAHHHHQILSRFPPIIDHHSFMAYSHHLNTFPFGHQSLEPPSAHKRLTFDFHSSAYSHRQELFPSLPSNNQSEELISSLLAKRDDVTGSSLDERRKRNRTFIDPVSEVPRLEAWFSLNTHPSHALILKYTEELNRMPYRQKFPKLEPKNVQFWFKNRRAKSKRLKMAI